MPGSAGVFGVGRIGRDGGVRVEDGAGKGLHDRVEAADVVLVAAALRDDQVLHLVRQVGVPGRLGGLEPSELGHYFVCVRHVISRSGLQYCGQVGTELVHRAAARVVLAAGVFLVPDHGQRGPPVEIADRGGVQQRSTVGGRAHRVGAGVADFVAVVVVVAVDVVRPGPQFGGVPVVVLGGHVVQRRQRSRAGVVGAADGAQMQVAVHVGRHVAQRSRDAVLRPAADEEEVQIVVGLRTAPGVVDDDATGILDPTGPAAGPPAGVLPHLHFPFAQRGKGLISRHRPGQDNSSHRRSPAIPATRSGRLPTLGNYRIRPELNLLPARTYPPTPAKSSDSVRCQVLYSSNSKSE